MSHVNHRPRRPIGVALIAAFAVAACSSTDHRTSAPATAAAVAATSTASTTTARSSPTTVAPTTVPTSATIQPDGATQARLHVVLTDMLGPNTDLFVNGAVAVNGGQAQVNVPVGYVTAYLYLPPGTHDVAVGTNRQGIDGTPSSTARACRWSLATATSWRSRRRSPTTASSRWSSTRPNAAPISAPPRSDPVTITLNNLVGATTLSYEWAGKVVNPDIPFGGFGAGIVPAGEWSHHGDSEGHDRHGAHRRGQLRRPGRHGVRVLRSRRDVKFAVGVVDAGAD